jgi:hypothetical protein
MSMVVGVMCMVEEYYDDRKNLLFMRGELHWRDERIIVTTDFIQNGCEDTKI